MEPILGKADLHIHSQFSSDGFSSIRDIFEIADKKNLDVIAITDHDIIKGLKEAEKIAPEFKVKLVRGEEIGTREGHLIGLFINDFIAPQRPILDTIREIHNQRGLAIVPHPFDFFRQGVSLKTLFKIYKEIDGIELFNASWLGLLNLTKIKKLNSQNFNLASIGGSDAHVKHQVGAGYSIFQGKTPSDLYFSIKEKLTRVGRSFDFRGYFETLTSQSAVTIKRLLRHGKI